MKKSILNIITFSLTFFVYPELILASPKPVIGIELPKCQKVGGTELSPPIGNAVESDVPQTSGKPTPPTAPGAVTVTPKTANCLINTMGRELLVLAPMSDKDGIEDAYTLPGAGSSTPLDDEQMKVFNFHMESFTHDSKDKPILVYCHHLSCFLSYNLVTRLHKLGYKNLLWMRDGIKGWKENGLKTGLVRKMDAIQYPDVKPRVLQEELGDSNYPKPIGGYNTKLARTIFKERGISHAGLCDALVTERRIDDPSNLIFEYRKLLYKAANVELSKDNDLEVKKKISSFWKEHEENLFCYSPVEYRSFLMTAIVNDRRAFLNDAIEWGVPLNSVDFSNGRTALDQIEVQYNKTKNPQDKQYYEHTYAKLRKAGALNYSELTSLKLVKSKSELQTEYSQAYIKAAQEGEISSMLHLAYMYKLGKHTEVNNEKAAYWWKSVEKKIVDTNDYERMTTILGHAYYPFANRENIFGEDESKAFYWYKRSLEGGYDKALEWIGWSYVNGVGVSVDRDKGIEYLQKYFYKTGDWYRVPAAVAQYYFDLGNIEKMEYWMRSAAGASQVNGMDVAEWFQKGKANPCGPRPVLPENNCNGGKSGSSKQLLDAMSGK